MSEILVDDKEDFYRLVQEGSAVVLFTAPSWCIPCRRFEPHWKAAAQKSQLTFITVDMGDAPEVLGEHWATREFSIKSVPSVLRFYDKDSHAVVKSRALIPFIKELESIDG